MNTAMPHAGFATQEWAGLAADSQLGDRSTQAAELAKLQEKLHAAERETRTLAAVLELLTKLEQSRDLRHACFTLVSELRGFLECDRVALGLCAGRQRSCRLMAASGMPQFDARSEFARAVEAAMGECLMRDALTIWPAADDSERHGTLAHQRLCSVTGIANAYSLPLRTEAAGRVGVLLFLGRERLGECSNIRPFVRICEARLGHSLDLIRRAEPGRLARMVRTLVRDRTKCQLKAAVVAAALAFAGLSLPMPYKIGCACQVQPVTRRFVAAPFDGTLEKSLVKQGDVVAPGQVLARMDGREIRWELAGLVAERNRAGKQRDSALATHRVADAQAAKLDMDRLGLKIQLLEHRTENLEVKSPIDGVVISGDLDKAEGAPLSIGQTLFEIAPLERMVVDVEVPEEEISHVAERSGASVRLDAYPGRTWNATIAKIHPRSEIRDARNVFVAELNIENPDGLLRPGMNGRAKITGPRRALAWNLFHKPIDWLARTVGC
jgi:biotin carboxyl carrier protein